jgi:hypothetical protein
VEINLPPADTAAWTFSAAALDPNDSAIHADVLVQRRHEDVFIIVGGEEIRFFGTSAERIGLAIVAAARGDVG